MTFRVFISVIALVVLAGVAVAGVIRDGSLTAESTQSGTILHWTSDNESGVANYLIERSIANNPDQYLVLVPRYKVQGNGYQYQYLDETAFKTDDSFYRYRVTPLDLGGNAITSEAKITGVVHLISTGVRRTWGSIKALFR